MTNQMFGYRTLGFGVSASSGFDPLTVAGCQVWLRADTGVYEDSGKVTPATDDGDVVGAWEDQSGQGNDATQGTTANKPALKLSIVNSQPVIRFVTDDVLTNAGLSETQSNTIFIVAAANSGPGSLIDGNHATNRHQTLTKYSTDEIYLWAGTPADYTTTSPITTSNFYLITFIVAGSSSAIRVDGSAEEDPANTGTNQITGYRLGSNFGGHWYLDGDIAEMIFYDSEISGADLSDIETYLMDRYGIS